MPAAAAAPAIKSAARKIKEASLLLQDSLRHMRDPGDGDIAMKVNNLQEKLIIVENQVINIHNRVMP